MARIQTYEFDKTLTGSEYLIGTDTPNGYKTSSYGLSDITNYVLGNNQGDGILGKNGLYTWLKYSANSNGASMVDIATPDTIYIGLAYNKDSKIESQHKEHYIWTALDEAQWTDENGAIHYTWIKYGDTVISGINDNPVGKTYVGFSFDNTTSTTTENYEDYLWSKLTPNAGIDGIYTANTNLFTWVKYADDINGNGISDSPVGKLTIGIGYSKDTYIESSVPTDYKWSLISSNTQLDPSGKYTWIKYADTPVVGIDNDSLDKLYIGLSFDNVDDALTTNYDDYQWSSITTDSYGDNIIGLPNDGDNLFTWVKYADDINGNGISDYPVNKVYIGLALGKADSNETIDPTDYTWTYIAQDHKTTGEELWTWVQYAETPYPGAGEWHSDVSQNTWMGVALAKDTEVTSTTVADYTWYKVPLRGGIGSSDELLMFPIDASLQRYSGVLGSNISNFLQSTVWSTGDPTDISLYFTPTNLISIHINGLKLYSLDQYSITLPNTITIIQELFNGDVIDIRYEHYVTTP